MKNTWKWILGFALVLVLFFGPYLFQLVFPTVGYGYGMMGSGRGGMMGGFGFFPFGMGLMWLIPLGTIALIVLGVVWPKQIGKPAHIAGMAYKFLFGINQQTKSEPILR